MRNERKAKLVLEAHFVKILLKSKFLVDLPLAKQSLLLIDLGSLDTIYLRQGSYSCNPCGSPYCSCKLTRYRRKGAVLQLQ